MAMTDRSRRSRGAMVNAVVFLLGFAALLGAVNYFAQRPELRVALDATKLRRYPLSEQTLNLLKGLQGEWTIAILMVEEHADRTTLRQVDEVLARFVEASSNISVVRVDPTDPATLSEYESLLARLRRLEADTVAQYDTSIERALAAFRELRTFAQLQGALVARLVETLAPHERANHPLAQRAGLLGLLGAEGDQVVDAVEEALAISQSQPVPDYEGARSILATTLSQWAAELQALATLYEQVTEGSVTSALAGEAAAAAQEASELAQGLALAADPLKHLPPLELSVIGRQLQQGDAAVVIGTDRAAAIPSSQLFPKLNLRRSGSDRVSFDQRFRGEQLIAAAIRSLGVDHMPLVCFVHAEPQSMLAPRDRKVDLYGVATMLAAARYGIAEWRVPDGSRPAPAADQSVVWIIVPPAAREGLEPTRAERALLQAAETLLAEGEPVMLNLHPSLLPKYQQGDPWAQLAEAAGVQAHTARVVLESVRVSEDETSNERGQAITRFAGTHPIARALDGQQTYFALPVPLRAMSDARRAHEVIAAIPPSGNRWLEEDWSVDPAQLDPPREEERLAEPVPIVIASERPHASSERERQRILVVGSGGWMLSYIADVVVGIGGERVALANPGNHELMLAAVAWLAGADEFIAPSPISQQVARLEDITGWTQIIWFLIAGVGAPVACLVIGAFVSFWRRA